MLLNLLTVHEVCLSGHLCCRCCTQSRRTSIGDFVFCVQLLLKRGATTPTFETPVNMKRGI